jgi:tRNA (guanine37-N1)-methyltransferase
MFESVFGVSIIKRAIDKGLISLEFVNIRDFSSDKHKRVDDYPYGAGGGLVMQPMPIYAAYEHLKEKR